MLLFLIRNWKLLGAGLAIASLLLSASLWYRGQLKTAYQQGYDARQLEVLEEQRKLVAAQETQNKKLQISDAITVEYVIKERIKTQKVIEYVDRWLPTMDITACPRLPDNFVRSINAAITKNIPDDVANRTLIEEPL